MYSFRAFSNQLGVRKKPLKVYIISNSFLSRRYIFLNIGTAMKGPTSVLFNVRDAVLGLKIKHKLISQSNISLASKNSQDFKSNPCLLLSWNSNKDDLILMLSRIGSHHLLIGPNVDMNEDLANFLKENPQSYAKFIIPSKQVSKSLEESFPNFAHVKQLIWPVGVETRKWKHKKWLTTRNNSILIYTKGLLSEEDTQIIRKLILQYPNIEILEYKKYNQKTFYSLLQGAIAAIWFGSWESQGIAMAESWSCGVPTFVRVQCECKSHRFENCEESKKFSPYLSRECGIYFRNESELSSALNDYFDDIAMGINRFQSRAWIENNLETRKQLLCLLQEIPKWKLR